MAVNLELLKKLINKPPDHNLPSEWKEDYWERVAILEIDAGLSSGEAKRQASKEIFERIKLFT